MNERLTPVCFSKQECYYNIFNTSIVDRSIHHYLNFKLQSDALKKSFLISTNDIVTATLINNIWDAAPVKDLEDEPRIIVKHHAERGGRYIDLNNRCQLLGSTGYLPFTFIKQSLRWEFAFQCYGSPFVPLHGVVIEWNGKCVCISGNAKSGKSFLADFILDSYSEACMLIDDWSLLNSESKEVHRSGDTYLHIRGSTLQQNSSQLRGGEFELIELCDSDLASEETRFLVKRDTLPSFRKNVETIKLDAFVFIRNPFQEVHEVVTDPFESIKLLNSEANHFWDDSNLFLPNNVFEEMYSKWRFLVQNANIIIVDGHRQKDLSLVTEKIACLL